MTREEAKDYIREWCPYDRQEEIIKALEQAPTKEEEKLLQIWRDNRGISMADFEEAMDYIKNLPTVQPEQRTGEWVWDINSKVYRCSLCKRFPWRVFTEENDEIFIDLSRTNAYKYCPNCGAKMTEGSDKE